ncbi:hypothetical protein ACFL29_01305 [Patescibacteria group bacterium]
MNFKQYITLMTISAGLMWLTWGLILFNVNPTEAGWGIFFLFYASLLLAAACSLAILGFVVRVWLLRYKKNVSMEAGKSFRQAVLLAALITGLLYFQSKNILNWWTIILFIAVLTLAEFFLISYKNSAKE